MEEYLGWYNSKNYWEPNIWPNSGSRVGRHAGQGMLDLGIDRTDSPTS